ncbi:MAG TPA: pyridoxine 5'-phosphate synthase, partial [Gillisia sp.]|nr:pyridoxine 5'-phosphate synthase [Gillisia sp.]
MTHLSVNINKIATLRNARGGDVPNLVQFAKDIESFGAQGITVHPRPDERHIRYQDVMDLKPVVTTEFNIEGNPVPKFIDLVLKAKPEQVTLVPDSVDAITSNAGWDTLKHKDFLKEVISEFKSNNIRTSIFVDPNVQMVENAVHTGADRIELYT